MGQSSNVKFTLGATAIAALLGVAIAAPASAALEDLDPENLIASVEISPDVVTTTTDSPETTTVAYSVALNLSCGDFTFPAECDSFTFRYQYAYFVNQDPGVGGVLSDQFLFDASGRGAGTVDVPGDVEPGDWYLVLDLEIAVAEVSGLDGNYSNHPVIVGSPTDPAYRLPEGEADRFVVLAACSGCGGNQPPTAADDAYSTGFDEALVVDAASGVLANDFDPDGDAVAAAVVSGPSGGDLTLNSNGGFSYLPAPGFSGEDSFTYTAGDGELSSAPATVTIDVEPWADLVGPEVRRLHVTPGRLTVGREATVTAVIDDGAFGASTVAEVEINVDGAGWEPMAPKRGEFDSARETAQRTVPLTTAGALEICVRGVDSAGNTGPMTCAVESVG